MWHTEFLRPRRIRYDTVTLITLENWQKISIYINRTLACELHEKTTADVLNFTSLRIESDFSPDLIFLTFIVWPVLCVLSMVL
jgi:hypothetical protein